MDVLERRLVFFGIALMFVAFTVWAWGSGSLPVLAAPASVTTPAAYSLAYYGADLGTGMKIATGVDFNHRSTRPTNAPWPQAQKNYCFLASVQALTNYEDWRDGIAIRYPHQSDEGKILNDMNNSSVVPNGGGGGFTKANISADFGGDPRAQAWGAFEETPSYRYYHQYIYHNGVNGASFGLAKGVAATHRHGGNSPEIAIVDRGLHSVIVAGVWSYGNPVSVSTATINSFAVYNSWDQQSWGSYINGAYYEQVSYTNWTQGQSTLTAGAGGHAYWWKMPYGNNSDPEPNVGMYKPTTAYPHHWWTNYVAIQRDDDSSDNTEYAHDEHGSVMRHP